MIGSNSSNTNSSNTNMAKTIVSKIAPGSTTLKKGVVEDINIKVV